MRAGESVCGAGVSHGGSGSPVGRGGRCAAKICRSTADLVVGFCYSGFMKILLVLGLAFILLLLLLILMFVRLALL